jgi:hypothetical protein
MNSLQSLSGILLLSASVFGCSESQSPAGNKALPLKDSVVATAPEPAPKPEIHYHFAYKKEWARKDSFEGNQHRELICYLNRVDDKHLNRLDSFIMPDRFDLPIADYLPFPEFSDTLKAFRKIILFSYPTQTFAAYESGKRILTGPTNMGKKATKTPTGLFFCNWKSKETRSTVNEEWILKWNFNVSNMGGVGFHQYDLPGYPASHSCMRLLEEQAKYLYSWAEQWKLTSDGKLSVKGTPVLIFGEYPFGQPRPWFALVKDPHALDINEEQLGTLLQPHREAIMAAQATRAAEMQAAEAVPAAL